MKSSFNAYGRTRDEFGNLTIPIWLGNHVEAVPVGGTLDRNYLKAGALYQAGCPINIANKVITPFLVMQVTAVEGGVLTVNVGNYGIEPTTKDYLQKVGNDLSSLGAAVAITAVEETETANVYKITATIDGAAMGDVVVLSPVESGAVAPNSYLYNDIFIGKEFDVTAEETAATGAAIMFNHSGILIDRTPANLIKAQIAKAVPGVYQHNE